MRLAGALDEVVILRGNGPVPDELRDPRVAAVLRDGVAAVSVPRWRERPFRWDLDEGAVEEWAAHWHERGWTVVGEARAGADPAPRPAVAIFVDGFPELSETFVAAEADALRRAGHEVVVEARVRPAQAGEAPAGMAVRYAEEDEEPLPTRLAALAWLVARHPLACLADLRARRRWAAEEPVEGLRMLAVRARRLARLGTVHLHAHFARRSALDALRLGRLLGAPASMTAHAWDIYLAPTNLAAKLEGAHFATSGCDATVADLRAVAPSRAGAIFKVVMGVDPGRFRRTTPLPGGRHVVAVGRLVPKKGFVHLVRAAARLDRVRVTIVGAGPEHDG